MAAAAASRVTNSKPLLNNEPSLWPWACEGRKGRENPPTCSTGALQRAVSLSGKLMQTFRRNVSLSVWKWGVHLLKHWTNKQVKEEHKCRWRRNTTTKTNHTQDDSYFNISSEKFTLTVVTSLIMISFTYLIWNEAQCVRCVLCWLPAVKKGDAADWGAETPILSHLYRRRMIAPNIFKLKQHLLGPGELNVGIRLCGLGDVCRSNIPTPNRASVVLVYILKRWDIYSQPLTAIHKWCWHWEGEGGYKGRLREVYTSYQSQVVSLMDYPT